MRPGIRTFSPSMQATAADQVLPKHHVWENPNQWSMSTTAAMFTVDCFWSVMAQAQELDFVFWWNGQVHLNRRGRQFSRLLAAEVCTSVVVMLDVLCSKVVWGVLTTHSIHQFSLHFPSHMSPCAITFQLDSNMLLSETINLKNLWYVLTWYISSQESFKAQIYQSVILWNATWCHSDCIWRVTALSAACVCSDIGNKILRMKTSRLI